jgi:hypothetical protein
MSHTRRILRLGLVFMVISAVALLGLPGNATHDMGHIELDANVDDATPSSDPRDWGSIFDSNGQTIGAQLPANTIDTTGVIQDFTPGGTSDSSYHEQSNKDAQQINESAGSEVWGCKSQSNASDKNDLVNAYALTAKGTGAHADDALAYFGVERFDNSGTAFMGVWLFQSDVGCDPAAGKFTGKKTTGDILILSNFDNGGNFTCSDPANCDSLIAYKWTENPTSPATGEGTLTEILRGFKCSLSAADDDLCAEVNQSSVVVPWPMEDKEKPGPPNPDAARTLETSEFFEGGFSLTDLVPGGPCFSTYMAEARASAETTASLKDFVLGDLDTCASVTTHKFHDLNGNGAQDGSEPSLEGWEMSLYTNNNCSGSSIQSGTTDTNGEVRFTNLEAGTYSVQETQQSGWQVTTGGTCVVVNVTPGSSPTISFGNQLPASITAHKFEDIDGNGAQDAGDPDLADWEMTLYSTTNCTGTVVDSGTTDANGEILFAPPSAGTYSVKETLQTGWDATTAGGICQSANIQSSTSAFLSFGNQRTPGSVQASKFNDLNGNGAEDAGEPAIENWPMTLYLGSGCTGSVVETIETSANGIAAFTGVLVGDYSVQEGSDPNWTATTPTCRDITITSGSSAEAAFGNWQPASITAVKFEDKNGNTIQDAEEPQLAGWEMNLYPAAGCLGIPITSGPTADIGSKLFTTLPIGIYSVKETMQEGWEASTATCQDVTLTAGAAQVLKFGNKRITVLAAEVIPAPAPVPEPAQLAVTGISIASHLAAAFALIAIGSICLHLRPEPDKGRRTV